MNVAQSSPASLDCPRCQGSEVELAPDMSTYRPASWHSPEEVEVVEVPCQWCQPVDHCDACRTVHRRADMRMVGYRALCTACRDNIFAVGVGL